MRKCECVLLRERRDLDPLRKQRAADPFGKGHGSGRIAVEADGVRTDRHFFSVNGQYITFFDHGDDAGDRVVFICDHGARFCPGDQGAVVFIGSVRKDLACIPEAHALGGRKEPASGKAHKDQVFIVGRDRIADRDGQPLIFRGHVVHGAVRFDVLQKYAFGTAERAEGTDLVLHHGFQFFRRDGKVSAAESHQVWIARVGADPNAASFRAPYRFGHHEGIGSMKTAGHIGGADIGQHLLVPADGISAEAFAEVAVKIHSVHTAVLSCSVFEVHVFHVGDEHMAR